MTTPNASSHESICGTCGYDLAGLPKGLCPECAAPFDPDAPPTDLHHRAVETAIKTILLVVAVVPVLAALSAMIDARTSGGAVILHGVLIVTATACFLLRKSKLRVVATVLLIPLLIASLLAIEPRVPLTMLAAWLAWTALLHTVDRTPWHAGWPVLRGLLSAVPVAFICVGLLDEGIRYRIIGYRGTDFSWLPSDSDNTFPMSPTAALLLGASWLSVVVTLVVIPMLRLRRAESTKPGHEARS